MNIRRKLLSFHCMQKKEKNIKYKQSSRTKKTFCFDIDVIRLFLEDNGRNKPTKILKILHFNTFGSKGQINLQKSQP